MRLHSTHSTGHVVDLIVYDALRPAVTMSSQRGKFAAVHADRLQGGTRP